MKSADLKAMLNTIPDDWEVTFAGAAGLDCHVIDKQVSHDEKECVFLLGDDHDRDVEIKVMD